jgi:3-deoxy-manno-octulosonate cytidylyltransferase (CMP-KDO synthetase)
MGDRSGVLAVIPARYGSTRFEGKPLARLGGKAVILHVVEQAMKCGLVDEVVVATDDERILREVESAGFRAVMTSSGHGSGTERVAEVARESDAEIIVNIQGDEPMMDPDSIDGAVKALKGEPGLNVSTLGLPLGARSEFEDPNVVKVVTDRSGMALYFSRAPIPYNRTGRERTPVMKHLGLYVYRRSFLLEYAVLKPTELEMTEQLEQLRILEHGYGIRVVTAKRDSIGIDTPEDLKKAEALLNV